MSLRAVRLIGMESSTDKRRQAPIDVGFHRDRLKMLRIHTPRNPAKMIEAQSIRNRPDEMFITPSVRQYHAPRTLTKLSVLVPVHAGRP